MNQNQNNSEWECLVTQIDADALDGVNEVYVTIRATKNGLLVSGLATSDTLIPWTEIDAARKAL